MSWATKLKQTLAGLIARRTPLSSSQWEELQVLLLEGDLGPELAEQSLENLKASLERDATLEMALANLRAILLSLLPADEGLRLVNPPAAILFVGVNGTGKTTSIAKLAHSMREQGRRPLLVGADTFRAAAGEQLQQWATRLGLLFIGHEIGGDPSAVVFDAMEMAASRGLDPVLIDTAGRQHTTHNLMEELKKIKRVLGKKKAGEPQEVLLVLDANAGMNAIAQAQVFHETLGVTGLILAKFDSPARAGFLFSIARQWQLPTKFVGVGEKAENIRPFTAVEFLDQFLS
jgi:fused signal recognition particle receptor